METLPRKWVNDVVTMTYTWRVKEGKGVPRSFAKREPIKLGVIRVHRSPHLFFTQKIFIFVTMNSIRSYDVNG